MSFPTLEQTLLNAANGNQTGPVVDLGGGDLTDTFGLQVSTAGTVTAFSVQVQGSDDGVNFVALGTAVTAVGLTRVTGIPPVRYLRAVLSGWTGTGTITVTVAIEPLV